MINNTKRISKLNVVFEQPKNTVYLKLTKKYFMSKRLTIYQIQKQNGKFEGLSDSELKKRLLNNNGLKR